jgi:hypothetical protein
MRAVLLRPPQKPTPKKFNSPPSRRPAHAVGRLPVYLRVAGTPAPSRARCGLHRDGAWGPLTINSASFRDLARRPGRLECDGLPRPW